MNTTVQQAGKKRTIHHLETPFSTTAWPEISPGDQDTILELLCNLLSPLGQHRRVHIKPSNGKRALKKEKPSRSKGEESLVVEKASVLPKPAINDHVDIGFNSITRNLESLSKITTQSLDNPKRVYSMVFVARGNQSSAFNCHFPQMVGAASKDLTPKEKIRLVGFSKPCSERLGNTLGISRVSSLAITINTPGAEALLAFVREHVAPVGIPWLDGNMDTLYRATQISSIETISGPKRVKQTL